MNIGDSIEIEAPAAVVWRIFTDVEQWSDWTPSVTSVDRVNGTGVEPGATVLIKQPGLPRMAGTVDELEPDTTWAWTARSPGSKTTATHRVEPTDSARTRVEQHIRQTGVLGRPAGWLMRAKTKRFLGQEAAGLKQRCEREWRAQAAPRDAS
jgi:uncharacterized protein YndB with AHSA1/START domain